MVWMKIKLGEERLKQLSCHLKVNLLKKQKLAEKHSFLCKLGLLKLHNDSSLNAILQNIF